MQRNTGEELVILSKLIVFIRVGSSKMGMKMGAVQSQVSSVQSLLTENYFRPAAVQREYQWTSDQCGALLSDFIRASGVRQSGSAGEGHEGTRAQVPKSSPAYFLGTFVLKPEGEGRFQIFDGLQRLTTLTILFSVLRDLIDGHDVSLHEQLSLLVLDPDGHPHLTPGGADQTLANLIQKRSEAVRLRRNLSDNTLRSRLLSAASVFRSRLKDWPVADVAAFADYILRNVLVGRVEVADERLARQIFITTNNRGVPLNEADVLKSQINSIPYRQDTAERVLSGWNRVRERFGDGAAFTEFLYAMDFISRRQGRGAEGLTQLGEHLATTLDDEKILFWMDAFDDYAQAWLWLMSIHPGTAHPDPSKGEILPLFAFEWPEWQPAALELARQWRQADATRDRRRKRTLARRFAALHRGCAAITLEDFGEPERTSFFVRALNDVQGDRNPGSHSLLITDERAGEVSLALLDPFYEGRIVRQVFRWLEAQSSRKNMRDVFVMSPHQILPARVEEFSEWERSFPDKEERWRLAHALGNYALVAADGPGVVAEDFRSWKKAHFQEGAGLDVNARISKARHWTREDILTRTDSLRQKILEVLRPAK